MKQKSIKFGFKVLGHFLKALILLVFIAYALLHTPAVQDKIAQGISQKLSTDGLRVEIKDLRGLWPFYLSISSCTLSDDAGKFAEIRQATLRWRIQKNRIKILSLELKDVDIERLPVKTTEHTSSDTPKTLNAWPIGIELAELSIDHFRLGPDITGMETQGTLKGSAQLPLHTHQILASAVLEAPEGKAEFSLESDLAEKTLDIKSTGTLLTRHRFSIDGTRDKTQLILETHIESLDDQERLDLTIQKQAEGWQFSGEASRKLQGENLHATFDLLLRPEADGITLEARQIHLSYPPWNLKNPSPLHITLVQGNYILEPLELALNDIRLSLQAKGNSQEIIFDLNLPEQRLELFPFPGSLTTSGTVGASLKISGPLAAPTAEAELQLHQLQIAYGEIGERFTTDTTIHAKWTPQLLELTGTVTDEDQNQVHLTLSSSESWSLHPFHLPWRTADFAAGLNGSLNLASLNSLPALSNQRLGGTLKPQLHYQRIKGASTLEGSLQMDNGTYENYTWGTQLKQIAIDLSLNKNGFEFTTLRAQTPGGGNIQGSGKASYTNQGWDSAMNLRLNKARIIHLDPVKVALSGNVQLEKSSGTPIEVNGGLILEDTLFNMDRMITSMPKPVPFILAGEEKTASSTETQKKSKPKPQRALTGTLTLDIPGRLTVEAKNLYSVWDGRFEILFKETGTFLVGKLSPRRGTLKFFSRSFALASGNVHFNGLLTDIPMLDLEAVYTRRDLEAFLQINGSAMNPTFTLQSNPPLPQDEILSRILFGKDMSTITALQAVEVGMAITSMMDSNRNADWDLMGKAKDFLKVDQLEFRESGDESGNAELVAGRQINNRLYFEFNKSLHEPGSTLLFEYEIKRNLSITTETGTHTLPGIGVNWKKDY